MIKQNEAVFKRKKKEEPRGGVVQDFNRALRLLSLHFDNCITALNTSPAVRANSMGQRRRFAFQEEGKGVPR